MHSAATSRWPAKPALTENPREDHAIQCSIHQIIFGLVLRVTTPGLRKLDAESSVEYHCRRRWRQHINKCPRLDNGNASGD